MSSETWWLHSLGPQKGQHSRSSQSASEYSPTINLNDAHFCWPLVSLGPNIHFFFLLVWLPVSFVHLSKNAHRKSVRRAELTGANLPCSFCCFQTKEGTVINYPKFLSRFFIPVTCPRPLSKTLTLSPSDVTEGLVLALTREMAISAGCQQQIPALYPIWALLTLRMQILLGWLDLSGSLMPASG